MEIKQGLNKFYVGESETTPLAEITYTKEGNNTIVVDHTFVSEELRGQKMAGKLVDRIVAFAREKDLKVIPTCPYAVKVLNQTQEYHDVLLNKPE